MVRRRIEMEKGGILPLERGLWFAAGEKLQEAEQAIEGMRVAKDRISFEAGWTRFVDSIEEFWARFYDEGKIKFSNFQPWAGVIDVKRKSDPLLQYVTQARHQSQHGRISLEWEPEKLIIAPGFNGHLRGLKIFPDGTFEMDATPLQGSSVEGTVVASPGRPLLPVIENKKFRQKYAPPTEHSGVLLVNKTPIGVAQAALSYYASTLDLAVEKFAPPLSN